MSGEAGGDRRETWANSEKVAQLFRAIDVALAESLRKGWYGHVRLDLSIMDGTGQAFEVKAERAYR